MTLESLEDRTLPSVTILNNGGSGYAGLDFNHSGGNIPPDTCGAAGPSNYVETVNQEIALYAPKATGATQVLDSLSHFWFTVGGLAQVDSGSSLVDPVVTYDDQAARFIVGDLDVDKTTHVSNLDLAVSQTSNPLTLTTADWKFYSISTTESSYDAFRTGNFGYNHDAVVFSVNMIWSFGNIFHTQVVSINSSDLVNGVAPGQLRAYNNDFDTPNMRPTTMHDSLAGDPMWFVAENGDNAQILVVKVTNLLSHSPVGMNTRLAVTSYQAVAPVLNPDGTVITSQINSQILKAAEANNTIVATHTVGVNSTQDAAQWYKIDVSSGTPVLADQGRVTAGNNTYIDYPAIDINSYGDIGMTFMRSGNDSSSDFLSMWVTARTPSDAAGTMQPPVEVPAGTGQANYTDFGHRAGEFSGINVDQSDGSFWSANEFANTEATANWGTAIADFTTAKTDIWSGGGSDSNWMTAANWVGNVAPAPGDNLVFPAGAAQLSNTNNFPYSTGFSSATISGNGYSMTGNGVLTGRIDASQSTGTNQFLVDVGLTGNQTITLPATAGNQLNLGNITNDGNTLTFTGGLGAVLVEGGISGAGGLTMSATGDLVLQNNNTFGGYGGPTLISSGTVSLTSHGGVPSGSSLTVNGTFDLGGVNDTVTALSGSGNIMLGSGTLTVRAVRFPGTTFSGVISGTGGLSLVPADVLATGQSISHLYLTGNNTYTGTTTVSGVILGGTGSIAGPVTVDNSSFGSVLAPGLPMPPYVGILKTGPVTFLSGSSFAANIRGPNLGTDYGQLNVNGSVSLTNAYLSWQITNMPQPALGQVYTIINATGPINGTFVAYPEGTLTNVGFATLAISYQGGGGTQVTLTVVAVSASNFSVSGFPSPVTVGTPGNFTVTALDTSNHVLAGYRGTIHFTSSDSQATLPADYTFTAADAGQHTFSATFNTVGNNQSLTATDTATGVAGFQANINVNPATRSSLVVAGFTSPTTAGVAGNFTVTAEDANGHVVTGYTGTVHFTSSDAQAILPADYTFTAGDAGVHTFSATLKTAGSQSITATDTVTSTITGNQTGITVNPAAASSLVVSGFPSPTTAGVVGTFTVTAKDPYGNTATGYTGTVQFTSSDAHAVLPANYSFVAADAGAHSFSATLKTAGSQSLTATDTVTGTITGAQTGITVNPAAASTLVVAGFPSPTTAGVAGTVTVTAKDPFGNTATGYTGTVQFTSSDAHAVLPANYSFVAADAGAHSFSATLKTAGSQSLTATDTVTGTITGSQSGITVNPAAASSFVVSGFPSPVISGQAKNVTVTALDPYGNTATGYSGKAHFTSTDGGAALPADYTFLGSDAGVHAFSATLETAGTQALTATDTVTASITGTEAGILVKPASFLVSGFPSPTMAGVAHSFSVTAKNANGTTATGYTGAVHLTSSDGQAVLPADYTFTGADAGVHTFSATLKTAGTQSLAATDTVMTAVTGAEASISVNPAAVSKLAVTGFPSPTVAGVAQNFTVTAQDPYGNTVAGYLDKVMFSSTDKHAILPATYTFTSTDAGVHSFTATLKTAGTQSITAKDTIKTTITGSESGIIVNAAAANHFKVTAPTTSTAGTAFSITVTALDPYGNTATGYTGTVHFTSSDKKAVLPADYAFTGGDAGVHVFSNGVTLKTAGSQTVTVTDTVTATITGKSSAIKVSAAAVDHLKVTAPATTTAGAAFSVTITAQDAFNNTATTYTGTIHFTSSDSQAVLPANYTFTSTDKGAHTFTNGVTLKTAGTQTITATDTMTATITGSATITLKSGLASALKFSAPSSVISTAPVPNGPGDDWLFASNFASAIAGFQGNEQVTAFSAPSNANGLFWTNFNLDAIMDLTGGEQIN